MNGPSDRNRQERLRESILGLGEYSTRKSHYPELQRRIDELERFRYLLDSSNDLFFVIRDRTGQIVDANASVFSRLGLSAREVIGTRLDDHLVEQGLQLMEQTVTLRFRRQSADPLWVEMTMQQASFSGEEYLVAVARDITERNRILEALTESENRYRGVVQQVSDGILIVERETGAIEDTNRAIADLLGRSRFALLGMHMTDILGPDSQLPDEGGTAECVFTRSDGSPVPVEVTATAVTYLNLQTVRCYVVRDITARVELERIRRDALEQLEQNILQFATLGDHIRNPLAVIVGLADLLETADADRIIVQAREIDRIIDQLDRGWLESEKVRSFLRKYY
jgi:PAS domain S-box-containing protein